MVAFDIIRFHKTNTHKVCVSEVGNVTRHKVQVLEGLGVLVDELIVELALDLVGGADGPPESLVQHAEHGLDHRLGHVDVAAGLHDFLVDQRGDLLHAVLLGAVELEGLAGGAVVVADDLEGFADVNGVDGPEALGHVVGGEDVGGAGQAVQEAVLETEHGRRPDDGGLGEDVAGDLLAVVLGLVELGWRVGVDRVGGDVDEAVDVVLGHGGGNAVGALDVDVLEVEVLGRVVAANQVEDHVRVAHALLNALGVAQVVLGEDHAAQVTGDLEMALGHLLAEGHDDGASCARESVDDVSAQEAGGTEDGGGVAAERAAAASNADYGLAGASDGNVLLDAAAGGGVERDGGFGEAVEQPGRGPSVGHCGVCAGERSGEVCAGQWHACAAFNVAIQMLREGGGCLEAV